MNFIRKELKEFKESNGLLIDVRSPEEYYKGHMPNSINIPLFNNEERVIVGKTYNLNGKEKAVTKGLEIVESKLEQLISEFVDVEKLYFDNKNNKFKIYCARGGMRSKSIFWLLSKLNYSVFLLSGGYKNYRRSVLSKFTKNIKIIIIGGKTGSGKTRILNILRNNNYQIIDLEFLANHRGSAFGGLGMNKQPSNEQFENLIAEELYTFDNNKDVFIEAESSNIGKCRIPYELFKQMKISPRIEVIRSERDRIDELISTYSVFSKNQLIDSVLKITKRLGPQRTNKAIESIKNEDWENVCKAVLEYYDKCYEHELRSRNNVKTLDLREVKEKEILSMIIKSSSKK
ncbi:MAG: tRNA 2-selenouridine(34) synthase MnmH [Prochlorococcus sp. SP3034]|nr:tRNA 2-selenouridine(34) synthase MnmH [Prochlorococcus sp. SP3034]|tara:strand:+ start:447 stop:1481 length:1035 start_codon:yes stop_codon:yes gene_type:complete